MIQTILFTREKKDSFQPCRVLQRRGVLRGVELNERAEQESVVSLSRPWERARVKKKKIVSNLLSTGFPVSHLFCVPASSSRGYVLSLSISICVSFFSPSRSRNRANRVNARAAIYERWPWIPRAERKTQSDDGGKIMGGGRRRKREKG